jgi:hypothetical protein
MRCVRGTNRKYALDMLALPSLWPKKEGLYLTQIKVVALEEAGFLLLEKTRCPFVNPIGDDMSTLVKQLLECAPRNLFGNGTFYPCL